MNFDENFTEVCSLESCQQYSIIGTDNGLVPNRWQAIIWTHGGGFTDEYMHHLVLMSYSEIGPRTYQKVCCYGHYYFDPDPSAFPAITCPFQMKKGPVELSPSVCQ